MPNKRLAAILATAAALVALTSVPAVRRVVVAVAPDPWHFSRRPSAAMPPGPQREAASGQPGPRISVPIEIPDAPNLEPLASVPAPDRQAASETDAPPGPGVAVTDPDAGTVRQAIEAYRRGDVAGGDALGQAARGPIGRLAIEWAALRLRSRDAGVPRLDAFALAHPDWPALPWLRRRIEEAVAADPGDVAAKTRRLTAGPLLTVAGKVALARIERQNGQLAQAAALVRQVWREEEMSEFQEAAILRDLGDLLDKEDHRIRAERLLYKEQTPAALREAALAGPDVVLLAKARAAVIANAASDAAIAAVPKPLQADAGLIFSRIQKARRANKIADAAALMLAAPRDPAQILDGDEWWVERRLVARKLLDRGDARTAYRICADHAAASAPLRIEAEFHAGWIALRFLDDPARALDHFGRAATWAETPISKSRAAYWQGRAAEAAGKPTEAAQFYDAAARYPISYYGQLAAARLGRTDVAPRPLAASATGEGRSEAVRVAELLFGLGARDIAMPLAIDIARFDPSEAQVGALAAVVARLRDAPATLAIGKAATQRGMALDEVAFPTFGIPDFRPLPNSADLAIVYAIARQESEFEPRSASSAGAKGLMQMIPSTARRTAEQAGIGFDETRLVTDAAFNAQLGAAHLGALMGEQGGSYILTFAAYNAGGRNVKDWIEAYGDPRKPGVDPVDWIERIPFTETRNYVQRVLENLQMYRARLGRSSPVVVGVDAGRPGRGT